MDFSTKYPIINISSINPLIINKKTFNNLNETIVPKIKIENFENYFTAEQWKEFVQLKKNYESSYINIIKKQKKNQVKNQN
jgi:hypothetical protein